MESEDSIILQGIPMEKSKTAAAVDCSQGLQLYIYEDNTPIKVVRGTLET